MDDERGFPLRQRRARPVLWVLVPVLLTWLWPTGLARAQGEPPGETTTEPESTEELAAERDEAEVEDETEDAGSAEGDDPEEEANPSEEGEPGAARKEASSILDENIDELGQKDEPSAGAVPTTRSETPGDSPPKARTHGEDDDDWVSWPFSDTSEDGPAQRWAGVGGFVGWVSRPSDAESIKYRPGVAYGGYIRPEITSWLGLRLFYREENIPVSVEAGAFNFEGETFDFDFTQPDLKIVNLGGRLEPTWTAHPRLRLRGVLGWSWLRMRAPAPQAEGFEIKKTFRAAVQTEITLGAGLSFDVVQDWLDVGVDIAHSLPNSRTGDAYEDQQVIVDGQIQHIGPLPRLEAATDIIFHAGLIL